MNDNLKWNAFEEIKNLLLGNEGIAEAVGNRVYPMTAPEGEGQDHIFCRRESYDAQHSRMGVYAPSAGWWVCTGSADYQRGLNLAETVCRTLEGAHPEKGLTIRLADAKEEYENEMYVQHFLFTIQ